MNYCIIVNDKNIDPKISELTLNTLNQRNIEALCIEVDSVHIKDHLRNAILSVYILSDKPSDIILTLLGYSLALSKNIIVLTPDEISALDMFDNFQEIIVTEQYNYKQINNMLEKTLEKIFENMQSNYNYCLESEKTQRIKKLWDKGCEFLDNNEYDLAIMSMKEIIAIKPSHSRALYKWGTSLLQKALRNNELLSKMNLLESAKEKYCESLKFNDKQEDTYNNLAIVLKQIAQIKKSQNKNDEAITLMNKAKEILLKTVKMRPDYCDAMYNLGLVFAMLYKYTDDKSYWDQSLECIEDAYDICPYDTDEINLFLARIYALSEDKDKCYECLKRCEYLGILPDKDYILKNPDFESIINEPWIENLEWGNEECNE
jgi:tetratricopeptide (TPR) repeat protein